MVVTRDGTTQNVSGTIASVAVSTRYDLRLRFIRSGTPTLYCSVNDGAETAVTANIPASGSYGAQAGAGFAFWIYNKLSTTQNLLFRYAGCTFGA